MNRLILNTFVFCFLLLFAACNDDDCGCNDGDILGKWEVVDYISLESSYHSKDNDFSPSIDFREDGSIEINLDANACFGNFELIDETGINILNGGCTERCCDSEFSLKFIKMLSQVSSYEIENEELKLNISGWGWFNLKWVLD